MLKGEVIQTHTIQMIAPQFKKVTIQLNQEYFQGKTFTIEVDGDPTNEPYIHSARLNGKNWNSFEFPWETFVKGGNLKLKTSNKPNKNWGIE